MSSLVHAENVPQKKLEAVLSQNSNLIGLAGLVAFFWILFASISPGFGTTFSAYALLRTVSVDVVIAFATMVVLAIGGMNLSIGAIGVCSAITTGYMLQVLGAPIAVSILGGLAIGTFLGFVNGLAIVKSGVSSFIITLASASVFYGALVLLTTAETYNVLPPEMASFPRIRWWVFSPFVGISLVVGLALVMLFRFSALGREILATGANPRAAELSGVRVNAITIFIHGLSGCLAALAAMMVVARDGAAMPSIGHDWLLPSFLAPVIGGTLLTGGHVSVVGTILGALLVAVLRTGLLGLNLGSYWLQLFLGLLLLAAVLIERARQVRAEKRKL